MATKTISVTVHLRIFYKRKECNALAKMLTMSQTFVVPGAM